jgi:23S rRNA (cytidine1920-2'-O)/16S rRNA (cytidine1409-2'-O)-methyltransferase
VTTVATRARLDAELVRRGLAESRERAQADIRAGRVLVGGAPADKPARLVAPGDAIEVLGDGPRFVSRGGDKLSAALDRFGIDPSGRRAVDCGASTGGFTDALLQAGAAEVVAIDVGRGQLHERLRSDPRVRSYERTSVRGLDPAAIGGPGSLVVADLSFISLRTVSTDLVGLCEPGGELVLLVKPQFEAGPGGVGKGGVVRDPAVWQTALRRVIGAAADLGLGLVGVTVSPLPGPSGNVEHFVHLRRGAAGDASEAIAAAVAAGVRLAAAPDR